MTDIYYLGPVMQKRACFNTLTHTRGATCFLLPGAHLEFQHFILKEIQKFHIFTGKIHAGVSPML